MLVSRNCARPASAPAANVTSAPKATRFLLNRGSRLTELLKQGQYKVSRPSPSSWKAYLSSFPAQPLASELQVPIIYAGVHGLLDRVAVTDIQKWEESFLEHLQSSQQALLAEISKGKMTPEIDATLRKTVDECAPPPLP